MTNLVPSFKDSLFSPTYDISAEYLEIGLDMLIESDITRDIPIVNSIASVCKIGYNLHERNLIKQTLAFILGYNNGTLSPEDIVRHRQELDKNPSKAEKELGRVLVILGNQVEHLQSQILGGFYGAYVNGFISWDKFCELSEANRRMFVSDYKILDDAVKSGGIQLKDRELYQVDRLISLGLLQYRNRLGGTEWINFDEPVQETVDIIVTSFGQTFHQYSPVTFDL